jgi:hypothetical protein
VKALLDRAAAVRLAVREIAGIDGRPETQKTLSVCEWKPGYVESPCAWCHVSSVDEATSCIKVMNAAVSESDPLAPLVVAYSVDAFDLWRIGLGGPNQPAPSWSSKDPPGRYELRGGTNVGQMLVLALNLARSAAPFNNSNLDSNQSAFVLGHDGNIALAEQVIVKARERARAVSVEIARRQAQVQAEQAGIQSATEACTTSPSACKAKCDSGNDPSFCIAWAWRLRDLKPPPLADERPYVKKACDAGNQTACGIVPAIDEAIQARAAKADELWSDVQSPGDEIAKNMWKVTFARSLEPMMPPLHRAQNERAIQRMSVYTQAVVAEKYCPAKREFVKQVGPTEFTKRAAAYCKDSAPTDTGKDGAEVTLTAQCRTAYATACP